MKLLPPLVMAVIAAGLLLAAVLGAAFALAAWGAEPEAVDDVRLDESTSPAHPGTWFVAVIAVAASAVISCFLPVGFA